MTASTERQLELTLNALARSVRRTLRHAEKTDPTGRGPAWEAVEHRAGLLQTMMKTVAEFRECENSDGRGGAPSRPSECHGLATLQPEPQPVAADDADQPPVAAPEIELPSPTQAGAAMCELRKARQKLARTIQEQLPPGAHKPAPPTQTRGKGWALVA